MGLRLGARPGWHSWDWGGSLPDRVWVAWARCMSTYSNLPVHAAHGVVPYGDRVCLKCACGEVGDEEHFFFRCTATAEVCRKYRTAPTICLSWPPGLLTCHAFLSRNRHNGHLAYFVFHVLRAYSDAPDVVVL